MSRATETDPRFIAEWVLADHADPDTGEFDPDATEYGRSVHPTLKAAQEAAIANGKGCDVSYWVKVRELHFNPSLGIPARSEAAWDAVREWDGDWDGNWCES